MVNFWRVAGNFNLVTRHHALLTPLWVNVRLTQATRSQQRRLGLTELQRADKERLRSAHCATVCPVTSELLRSPKLRPSFLKEHYAE